MKISIKPPQLSLYVIYTTLMMAYLVVERSLNSIFVYHSEFDADNISPFVGLVIGAFLMATYYSILIEKKKYRLVVVIGVVLFILYLIAQFTFLQEIVGWVNELIFSGTRSFIRDFLQGVILGMFAGFFIYTILVFAKNLLIFAWFYVQAFYSSSRNNTDELWFFAIQFVVILLAFLIFSIIKYKNNPKKLPVRGFILFGLLSALFIGMAFVVSKNINDELNQKMEIISEVRRQQMDALRRNDPNLIPIDQPVGQGELSLRLVGMYKAESPLYLKFELFRIRQLSDRLEITSVDTTTLSSSTPVGISSQKVSKQAQVMFARFPNQGVLSPEKTVALDRQSQRLVEGVLYPLRSSDDVQEIVRYEFSYTTYQDTPTITSSTYPKLDYTYVSAYADYYDEMKELAQSITQGAKTDLEKARAIESYFHNNFTYTLNPHFADKENPIDDFLFVTQKGYCVQYAVATSMLLEMVGVQSRMVGGYYSSLYYPQVDAYIIVGRQAHVWNEIYVYGSGWITIDSTPSVLDPDFEGAMRTQPQGVQLTEEELAQIKIDMQAVAPEISFDDMFTEREIGPPMQPGEVLEKPNNENNPNPEEQKKKLEELKKKQEEARRKWQEFLVNAKGVIVGLFWGGVFFAAAYGGYYLYTHRDKRRLDGVTKSLRRMDFRVRTLYIKKYTLSPLLLHESSKKFLQSLPQQIETLADVTAFYRHWNYCRFSGMVSEAQLEELRQQERSLRNRLQ